jgi:hypothetical protein
LGASGFNSFVVNIDAQKRWEMVSQDFGQSLIYEGLSTIDDVKRGLEEYISSLTKQGVEKKNIHFIISSGAQKNPKTKIIAAGLKNLGIDVKLITPNQEGQWALKCILPKSYYTKAFVADIGSGNTKLAWFDGKKVVVEEGPGSKYYEIDLKHDSVYKRLKKMAFNIPDSNRNICFIMGGTPSDLAKQNRNVSERYTKLQSPDTYEIKKAKTKAGLNIYKAIIDGTGCQTFIFDWDANFSIGYLLDLEQKEEN